MGLLWDLPPLISLKSSFGQADSRAGIGGYRGRSVTSITPRVLVIVNALLLAVCVNAAFAGDTPVEIDYWIGVSAILASNGLWHFRAAIKSRAYSPGMVTGLLLYQPLVVHGSIHFLKSGSVSILSAFTALLIGASYPWWSAVYHPEAKIRCEADNARATGYRELPL